MKKIIPLVLTAALLLTACGTNTPTESASISTIDTSIEQNDTGWYVDMMNYSECPNQAIIDGFGQGLVENSVYIGYKYNEAGAIVHGFAINVDNEDTFVYATDNGDGTYTYEVAEDYGAAFEEALAVTYEPVEPSESDVEPMDVDTAASVADEAAAQLEAAESIQAEETSSTTAEE